MKLLALLTPAAMLAALWALQRLEDWMQRVPGQTSPSASRDMARSSTGRSSGRRGQGPDRA